jgi:diguanylate cyclase (GGDEF)-like protein
VPLLVLSVLFVSAQQDDLEAVAQASLSSQAQLQAAAVNRVVDQAAEEIAVLAANPAFQDPNATGAQVRQQLEAFSLFDDVTLLDPRGVVIETTSYGFSGRWDAAASFRRALEGEAYMSPPIFYPEPERLVMEHSAPVLRDDEVIAVIVGTMNMERVWRALGMVPVGRTGYFAAFDRHGNVLAHPDKTLILRRLAGYPLAEAIAGETKLLWESPDGVDLIGYSAPVGSLDWHVTALQPVSEAYDLAAQAQTRIMLAICLVLLVAIMVALVLSRAVASPIRNVAAAMRGIADGLFDRRLDRPGLEEIDSLAGSFNVMAERLEERSAALEAEMLERDRAEERIRYQAYHDSLTGLPNRMLLKDRLEMAIADSRRHGDPLAVMFLDLDRFKLVNDSMGHSYGDELLLGVSDRITTALREGDSVARVGGDEYVLLLPRVSDARQAFLAAQRVMTGLREPWDLNGKEFRVTASIGIAMFPGDGSDSETLMRNADTAMYRAKEDGRDSIRRFESSMDDHVQARVDLERDLRRGFEQGQFVLHYQPQVEIASGRVVGLEALLRWQRPGKGLILPDSFIPVAEENGLISDLGRWVLNTACAQAQSWGEAGLTDGIPIFVNVSARQFHDIGIVDDVDAALEDSGLPAHLLELEITESTAMRDVEHSVRTLAQLREMGVRVSIDDFGTGYSSLSYLKRFPIDTVKIDRSFVRDVASDQDDAAIVAAIIALAKSLTMTTVAEGVETETQLEFLRQHDCQSFQGFIFSRALPPRELEELLAGESRSESVSRTSPTPAMRPVLATES